ncbi:CBS domain-containing protein [Streptomyces caniscabiei]|uniref:CBS domain-containing protein n=1 Tax=Streptomyces caniscabiei TaxID=2746961 RepID=UPI000A3B781E|nr:CBS domain-containing protein [Streptomyces caniscabiei]
MRAWVVRAGENGERERTALDEGLLLVGVRDAAHAASRLPDEETEPQTVAYRVSNLDSANRMPESVSVGDSLHTAMTIMVLRGYGQLPVLDADGRLRGVVRAPRSAPSPRHGRASPGPSSARSSRAAQPWPTA